MIQVAEDLGGCLDFPSLDLAARLVSSSRPQQCRGEFLVDLTHRCWGRGGHLPLGAGSRRGVDRCRTRSGSVLGTLSLFVNLAMATLHILGHAAARRRRDYTATAWPSERRALPLGRASRAVRNYLARRLRAPSESIPPLQCRNAALDPQPHARLTSRMFEIGILPNPRLAPETRLAPGGCRATSCRPAGTLGQLLLGHRDSRNPPTRERHTRCCSTAGMSHCYPWGLVRYRRTDPAGCECATACTAYTSGHPTAARRCSR